MKIFIPISIIILLAPILYFIDFQFMGIGSFEVQNNSTIIVGENEPCEGYNLKYQCEENLECVLISTYPQRNGICLKQGTKLVEDLTYRQNITNGEELTGIVPNY